MCQRHARGGWGFAEELTTRAWLAPYTLVGRILESDKCRNTSKPKCFRQALNSLSDTSIRPTLATLAAPSRSDFRIRQIPKHRQAQPFQTGMKRFADTSNIKYAVGCVPSARTRRLGIVIKNSNACVAAPHTLHAGYACCTQATLACFKQG